MLYDMLFLLDFKCQDLHQAFGELLEHLQWQSWPDADARGFLGLKEGFYLVITRRGGHGHHVTHAPWGGPGTANLIRTFFPETPWERAIREACAAHKAVPVRALGRGGFGRVIRVRLSEAGKGFEDADREEVKESPNPDPEWALKVVLTETSSDWTRIQQEHSMLNKYCDSVRPLPTRVKELICKAGWAAYLMQPVGKPIEQDTASISRALISRFVTCTWSTSFTETLAYRTCCRRRRHPAAASATIHTFASWIAQL
jgi:hypothetical protein